MMRNLLLVSILLITTLTSFSQADSWMPMVQDGFGIANQKTVPEMEVFNDMLYVATAPLTLPGTAKLWRSGTGDAPWEDVTPPLMGDVSIHSFGKTDLGGGYFWCATGNNTSGMVVYQSRNGKDWVPISKRGFGTSTLNGAAPNMIVFQGSGDTQPYLYAGAGSHGAGVPGEVWRIPYTSTDSNAWVKLMDFDTVPTNISDTVDLISYFEVWKGKIYFGTNAKGQLWESTDGVNFEQNMEVGYGFAPQYLTNVVISAIEIFKDTMYLTTTNFGGGQLWQSADGNTFTNITNDAFGEGMAVSELRKPIVANNHLWITGYTETEHSTGTPVWKSEDGTTWKQSNVNGFGDTLNNGQNASLVGFKDYVYCGVPNYTNGGQVWRTQNVTDIGETKKAACAITFSSNPASSTHPLSIRYQCSPIKRVDIFSITGQLMKTTVYNNERKLVISLEGLTKGIYLLRVHTTLGNTKMEKLLVN